MKKSKSTTKLVLLCAIIITLLFSLQSSAQQPSSIAVNVNVEESGSEKYSIDWNWSASTPDRMLIVYSEGGPNTAVPVDGQTYTYGSDFGSGKVFYDYQTTYDGETISAFSFSRSELPLEGMDYWFTIYPYNTTGGNDYNTSNASPYAFVTPGLVEEPYMQPYYFSHTVGESDGSTREVSFSYERSLDELSFPFESRYLVVYKIGSEITYLPTDGSPHVTGDAELRTLSDGSIGRLDKDIETISVDVSNEEQILYVKIFAFNRANANQTISSNVSSYNYLTMDPMEFTAVIPAEPNSAPIINDQIFSVNENSVVGTNVGQLVASDAESDPLSYSITDGNTSQAFEIDTEGNISVNNQEALDFESSAQFVLIVSVSDGSLSSEATITIDVTNVNETPTVSDATFTINENAANATFIGQVISSDPENDALTYSITNGNTSEAFTIDALGNIMVSNQEALDFETSPQFILTVNATDESLSGNGTIIINLNDQNEAPEAANTSFSVDENVANGTSVGQISATDPENAPLTFSISNGNTSNAFAIDNAGNITTSNQSALDFEVSAVYTLGVSISDGVSSVQVTININLNNVNEAPSTENAVFAIAENTEDGTVVGQIVSADPDGDALAYTITNGNTNSAFSIDASGNVMVNNQSALDFENSSQFVLNISVSDGSFSSASTITINLSNVNEAPSIVDAVFAIAENSENGTVVGQIVSADPDGDAMTYSITNGNTSSGYLIDAFGNVFVNNQSALDFEATPQFVLTVSVSDGNLSSAATITINLSNINEAPSIVDAVFAIAENSENGTVVGQIVSADPDGDALAYTITNGNTNSAFTIDASGNVMVNNQSALDFETTPQFAITVNASDGSLSDDAAITINLNDVEENAGPTIFNQNFTIIESVENGDNVGTVVAVDAQDDPISYSIASGNTSNAFAINSSSGMLIVNDRTAIAFTPNASFTLEIAVSDGSNSNSGIITVLLNNAPTFNWTNTIIDVAENENFSITIPVTDAENDPLTMSISAASSESIVGISSDGTSIIPLSAGGIDYEVHLTIDLIIEATDSKGNISTSESVTLNITNLNDNAPTSTDQTLEIAQSTSNGTVITTVVGEDADGDDLAYSIASGNTNNAFSIASTTGEITVSNASGLTGISSFNLSIKISDGMFSGSASISINIVENSAPTIVDQVFSVEENSVNGTSVGTIDATDNEDDALTFSIISGNTDNAFLVVGSTGDILVINQEALDFEETPTFTLVVSVTDGKVTEVATITINLTDVDERVLGFETDSEVISVFPNPATHFFSLDLRSKVNHVTIWNMHGKLMKSFDDNQENKYPVSNLKSGLYTIIITTEESKIQSRLMIK